MNPSVWGSLSHTAPVESFSLAGKTWFQSGPGKVIRPDDMNSRQMVKTEPGEGALRYVMRWSVLKKSLSIALVVGCLLSVANQFDVILRGPLDARLGIKIFLNFLIPFAVASVSVLLNRNSA